MALTSNDINWRGYGKVTDADNLTGWAVIKTTSGGGTPSPALADGGLQGISGPQGVTTTSNAKRILLHYDIGAGNELDFSGGGTEEGQYAWVWGNFLASSLLETAANNGFGIMLGSQNGGSIDWSVWTFYGSDNYSGGWKRMVIDPTKTASLTGSGSTEGGGGINLASVRYFGIMAKTTGTARFDNMIVDRIDVGTGYAIDGANSTPDAFMTDLLAVEETTANWWGVVKRLNDSGTAFELTGKLTLGDNVGTTATTITDVNAKVFAGEPLYYSGGFVAAIPLDATGVEIVGNGTGATSVTLGKLVGADAGRNGWTVVGNATYNVTLDFDDGNVNTCNVYGSSFETITGSITMGTNATHRFYSDTWVGCGQVDPVGGVIIRNNIFVGYTGTAGALLWNASINVAKSSFIANADGTNDPAAIEVPSAITGPLTFDALTFSGNDFDVRWSATSGTLVVNPANGANPATWTAGGTATVSIEASVPVTITILNSNNSPRSGVRVRVVRSDTKAAVIDNLVTNASGQVTAAFSDITPQQIEGWARDYDLLGDDFEEGNVTGSIEPTIGFSQTIKLEAE